MDNVAFYISNLYPFSYPLNTNTIDGISKHNLFETMFDGLVTHQELDEATFDRPSITKLRLVQTTFDEGTTCQNILQTTLRIAK